MVREWDVTVTHSTVTLSHLANTATVEGGEGIASKGEHDLRMGCEVGGA